MKIKEEINDCKEFSVLKNLRIATIAGDGIGLKVLPQGIKVVSAVAKKYNISLQFESFDWASCDY